MLCRESLIEKESLQFDVCLTVSFGVSESASRVRKLNLVRAFFHQMALNISGYALNYYDLSNYESN